MIEHLNFFKDTLIEIFLKPDIDFDTLKSDLNLLISRIQNNSPNCEFNEKALSRFCFLKFFYRINVFSNAQYVRIQ